jgi:lysophospholipase L1-like esterase
MKTFITLSLLILPLQTNIAASLDTIPANNPLIEYTGRINFANPLEPSFSYSGVSIRAKFTGTSIGMVMSDNKGTNYYNIILDGKIIDSINVTTDKRNYFLAESLENTTHEIEIFKRTEVDFGTTRFYGFLVDKGASLVSIINKRERLFEYIGNSITCGYGNEGKNGDTFGPTTENHYLSYAAITSRNFNARHLAVCKSGIGAYRNYNAPYSGSSDNMTDYYDRVSFYDVNPKYSFAETPDLVYINLGSNDFSTNGGDPVRFKNNYYRLIDTIQTRYNKPDIICLVGPTLDGQTLNQVRSYIKEIVDSTNKKGLGNVYLFELSEQGSLGYGIDYHPNVAQHQKNAIELTNFIKSIKGWNTTALPDSKNDFDNRTIFYPNPNKSGIINYTLETAKNAILKVYSENGKIIHNQILINPKGQINFRGKLKKGIYYFKVFIGEKSITNAVVIE